jgi:hypothetical protein
VVEEVNPVGRAAELDDHAVLQEFTRGTQAGDVVARGPIPPLPGIREPALRFCFTVGLV